MASQLNDVQHFNTTLADTFTEKQGTLIGKMKPNETSKPLKEHNTHTRKSFGRIKRGTEFLILQRRIYNSHIHSCKQKHTHGNTIKLDNHKPSQLLQPYKIRPILSICSYLIPLTYLQVSAKRF